MKQRPSPYNTKCRGCGRRIAKGEQVWFAKHEGARCLNCGNADPSLTNPGPRPPPTSTRRGSRACPPAERGADGVYRFAWDSVSDLVEDAFSDRAQSADARRFLADLHREYAGDTWANGHTVESLQAAVSDPSRKLLDAIDRMRGHLLEELAVPAAPRRRVRRGLEAGDEMDPDRWLTRNPNCWEQSVRERQPRRVVTVGVNCTVYWSQKPAELLYRGAAACALADVLTAQGVNVRILGFSVGSNCSDRVRKLVTTVELKRADMPLDMAALATALCDVGFFRMVVMPAEFRHLPGKLCRSLGTRGAQTLPAADRQGIDFLIESDVTSERAAIDWLRSASEQYTQGDA